mmetsp:Transcript_14209/g.25456  ORF Transcript_14209/g.25456 Transcript_14209/m.25456 type:complete len:99 (+) Transcript_14209:1102-1398(+)
MATSGMTSLIFPLALNIAAVQLIDWQLKLAELEVEDLKAKTEPTEEKAKARLVKEKEAANSRMQGFSTAYYLAIASIVLLVIAILMFIVMAMRGGGVL